METTRKIAFACFAGAVLCCGVALLMAPNLWWLGILAGMSGGYLTYDLKEAWEAIPTALQLARKAGIGDWEVVIRGVDSAVMWLKKPHPFALMGAIGGLMASGALCLGAYYGIHDHKDAINLCLMAAPSATIVFGWIISFFSEFFAFSYAKFEEKRFWREAFHREGARLDQVVKEFLDEGLEEITLTYREAFRLTAWGLFGAFITIFVALPLALLSLIPSGARFVGRSIWHLVRIIHSRKRVLCAIDGTLGGVASYWWLAHPGMTAPEQVLCLCFGGLLGAVLGVLNWEIVSKRLLHVDQSLPAT